jgi:hypothetical protein
VAQGDTVDDLPDDYIPIRLHYQDGRLEGGSEFLPDFRFTLVDPDRLLENELTIDALFALVRGGDIVGEVIYPDGRTTPVRYEIVHHRGHEDIYMKSSLGYFLWEYLSVENAYVSLAIYWWYCPPATEVDLQVLDMAVTLLERPDHWRRSDDRNCDDDEGSDFWSLFCALKHASIVKWNEYNHHNTAIQTVRFVIDKLRPDHDFAHTLMDFNNAPSTRHRDILEALELARQRIEIDLRK